VRVRQGERREEKGGEGKTGREERRWRRLKIIPSDRLVIDWRGVEKWGKIDYIVRRRINCAGVPSASGPTQGKCQKGEQLLTVRYTRGNVRKGSIS